MAIKAYFFDVFGTLVDWRSGIIRAATPFLVEYGCEGAEPARFADAWRSLYPEAMRKVRRGERPFTRLDVLQRENLQALLPEFCTAPDAIPDSVLANLTLAWHYLDAWPDTVPGLLRLKALGVIAPLSNAHVALSVHQARHAGLPWDVILGAEIAQTYKPAPEVYRVAADWLGLLMEETCMVAAHNGDLAAARACGMHTCFLRRPHEHGAEQTTDLTAEQDWDFTIEDLRDLADAVLQRA